MFLDEKYLNEGTEIHSFHGRKQSNEVRALVRLSLTHTHNLSLSHFLSLTHILSLTQKMIL